MLHDLPNNLMLMIANYKISTKSQNWVERWSPPPRNKNFAPVVIKRAEADITVLA